jgi:hypothetical protein
MIWLYIAIGIISLYLLIGAGLATFIRWESKRDNDSFTARDFLIITFGWIYVFFVE